MEIPFMGITVYVMDQETVALVRVTVGLIQVLIIDLIMANKNSNLGAAKLAKNDEFYTQYWMRTTSLHGVRAAVPTRATA